MKKEASNLPNTLTVGQILNALKKANGLKPGISFYTASSDAHCIMDAKRKGCKISTHRLYVVDVASVELIPITQVTIIAVLEEDK